MPLQIQVFQNQATANMQKELRVLIDSNPIGSIMQVSGKYRFIYDSSWQSNQNAIPLSLSMPIALSEHDDKVVRPFMWGLLPESEDTLKEWGRKFHVSERNAFDLLSNVGEDLPGAIQMVPPENLDDLKKREGVTASSVLDGDGRDRNADAAGGRPALTRPAGIAKTAHLPRDTLQRAAFSSKAAPAPPFPQSP
jgi:HipA-like protein